jgi:hypothetical protein
MRFYPNGLTVLLHVCMRVRRVLDIASVRIILKRGGGLLVFGANISVRGSVTGRTGGVKFKSSSVS